MAKLLFVSYDGLIGDIAGASRRGRTSRFWIKDPRKEIADGFSQEPYGRRSRWADVVVFDDVLGMGDGARGVASRVRWSRLAYTDKLEDARGFGHQE